MARARASAWLLKQQQGDGTWSSGDGALQVQATASALQAMRRAGLGKSPAYASGLAWLVNADADSVDALARKVQALSAAGHASQAQREVDRLYGMRTRSLYATWGGFGGGGIDWVDTNLALAALRQGDSQYLAKATAAKDNTVLNAICTLLYARVVGGTGQSAWAATPLAAGQSAGTSQPSVMATALLAAELHAMQQRTGLVSLTCGSADAGITTSPGAMASEAVAWLLAQQNTADGGWGELRSDGSRGPSNVLLTTWVYQALISQAAVPAQAGAALNWLLAQQDPATGSWRKDPLVTASVVAALPAATGAQALDTDRDGVTDVVEAQAGSNAGAVDSRTGLPPPTLAAPGLTMSAFHADAALGQPFSTHLGPGSAFTITAGGLPPGLALDANTGQLSGVATQAGNYSFDYQFTSDGQGHSVIGRIDVSDPAATVALGEAPLPLWALLVLGGSLAAVGRRLHRPRAAQRRDEERRA